MTHPTLRFASLPLVALAMGTFAAGCNASFELAGANRCGGAPDIACFDCNGRGVSPVCGADGRWQCVTTDQECDVCDDEGIDCVDACGDFVAGECIDGVYSCPPIEGGVICEDPEPGGQARWATSYGSDGYEGGRAVAVDGQGNVIVAGHFQATLYSAAGSIEPVGGYDTFIAKHRPDGSLMWLHHYGFAGDERPSGLGVDADGNVVIAIGVTPEPSQPALPGPLTLLALGPNGVPSWERSYEDVYAGDILPMLAVGADGALTIVGSYSGAPIFGGPVLPTYGEGDFFVARLDEVGDLQWSESFGGESFDYVQDVDVDADGNVFLVGSYKAPIAFGAIELPSGGAFDGFVASLDSAGVVRWARAMGSTGNDLCARVAATGDGGAALTAAFEAAMDVDGSALVPDTADGGALVARLNEDGSLSQLTQLPGSGASTFMHQHQYSVAVDATGHLVVAGQFTGVTEMVTPGAASDLDMLLMRFLPSGTQAWGYSFGGFSADFARDVAVGPLGEIAVVGEYWGAPDFGTGPLESFFDGGVFLAQFDADGGAQR